MNCHACGAPETADDHYCPNCGALNTESTAFKNERGAPTHDDKGDPVQADVPPVTEEDQRRIDLRAGQAALQDNPAPPAEAAPEAQHMPPTAAPVDAPPAVETVANNVEGHDANGSPQA